MDVAVCSGLLVAVRASIHVIFLSPLPYWRKIVSLSPIYDSPSLTFLGLQSFFFRLATNPQSLQRKSPGLALRIGFPFWHDIAVSLSPVACLHYNTVKV